MCCAAKPVRTNGTGNGRKLKSSKVPSAEPQRHVLSMFATSGGLRIVNFDAAD